MSHISTFIDPIPTTDDNNPRLLLALFIADDSITLRALLADTQGKLITREVEGLHIQHVYDFQHEVWVDKYAEAVETMLKAEAEGEKKEGRDG